MTYWHGTDPVRCDVWGQPITTVFYDAKMPGAGWAMMHPDTFEALSCALGPGRGQRYEKQEDGRWLKTAG